MRLFYSYFLIIVFINSVYYFNCFHGRNRQIYLAILGAFSVLQTWKNFSCVHFSIYAHFPSTTCFWMAGTTLDLKYSEIIYTFFFLKNRNLRTCVHFHFFLSFPTFQQILFHHNCFFSLWQALVKTELVGSWRLLPDVETALVLFSFKLKTL